MSKLNYKGYKGTVDFSEADGVFYGKVEGVEGLVSYEGKTIPELTHSFEEAVEDYLACYGTEVPSESLNKDLKLSGPLGA